MVINVFYFDWLWLLDGKRINQLNYFAICVISDSTQHDTNSVFAFQSALLKRLKSEFAFLNVKIRHVHYFTDGCAAQYKNRKNFCNLFNHKNDFGLSATWHFFATAHGKGPCDAYGGTSKRLARLASERGHTIITAVQLYVWLSKNVQNIEYLFVGETEINEMVDQYELAARYENLQTISGTRQAHKVSVTTDSIMLFELSEDLMPLSTKTLKSVNVPSIFLDECSVHEWVGCVYDENWYIGRILDVSSKEEEVLLSFWVSSTPPSRERGTSFIPENKSCWIPFGHVLTKLTLTEPRRTLFVSLDTQANLDLLLKNIMKYAV